MLAGISGFLRSRRYQKLEEDGDTKSYWQLKSTIDPRWSVDARFRRDYQGNNAWSKRSLIYHDNKGPITEMIIGNYTARFGLGLTVGYRGRLLAKDESPIPEQFAFPEYGSFNGLYIEGGRKRDAVRMLLHYDRNDSHDFRAAGVCLMQSQEAFRWEGIALAAVIKNRSSRIRYNHYKVGTFFQYSKKSYGAALEASLGKGLSAMVPAVVLEAMFKTENIGLKFSAWHYDHRFVNLTGGGRAGSYYQTVAIDTVAFDFRDKRVDQRGILLKSTTVFDRNVTADLSFSFYGRNPGENAVEIIGGVDFPINGISGLTLDYETCRKQTPVDVLSEDEFRAGCRVKSEKLFLRSYLGYNVSKTDDKCISLFARLKTEQKNFGLIEVWFNVDRINYERSRIDYFYGYVMETVRLSQAVEFSAKYAHRYSRNYSEREQSTLVLEAKFLW
jgi:hypothetical protein